MVPCESKHAPGVVNVKFTTFNPVPLLCVLDVVKAKVGLPPLFINVAVQLPLILPPRDVHGPGGNINGNWTATLMNSGGSPTFAFTTSFTQSSGTGLNVVNFTFTTPGACFDSQQTTETGSFSLSGNFNGRVTGSFE